MDESDEPPAAETRVPTTAADFRELQREYSARRRFHEMQAETFARLEAEAGRIAAGMESPTGALRIRHESATTEPHMHVESAGAGRSKGQMGDTGKAHPFGKMLERRTTTVGDVAKFLAVKLKRKIPRATVQAWYRDVGDPYYRPIRRDAAEALKAEYAVPLSAWPRIRE